MAELVDRFLPAVAFAALLAREQEMRDVPFATARADMEALLAQAAEGAEGYRDEDVQNALFAVCAYADEAVLASDWPGRGEWLRRSLQRERFGTVNAGEEFYERLAALSEQARTGRIGESGLFGAQNDPALREVLEIYAACLTMGFTGRYFGEAERGKLAAITRESLDGLLVQQAALGERMFPEAYAKRTPTPPPSRLLRLLELAALLGIPALTALYLHAAYAALLAAWVREWMLGLS